MTWWLTAPAATASTTCAAGRWSAAPAVSPPTSPAAAPCPRPRAPSAAAAAAGSPRVCCRTPTCSAPAPLARPEGNWRAVPSCERRRRRRRLHHTMYKGMRMRRHLCMLR